MTDQSKPTTVSVKMLSTRAEFRAAYLQTLDENETLKAQYEQERMVLGAEMDAADRRIRALKAELGALREDICSALHAFENEGPRLAALRVMEEKQKVEAALVEMRENRDRWERSYWEQSDERDKFKAELAVLRGVFEERDRLKDALEDMTNQFAYVSETPKGPALWTGGLSSLELAFGVLGYDDPHPVPFRKCQVEDCIKEATCGTPTADGYKRLCGPHHDLLRIRKEPANER